MPRSLFDQSVITPPQNRKRNRTLAISIALHVIVLVGLVAAQLAAIEGPDLARRIDAVMIPAPPPTPPPPPPTTPATPEVVSPLNPDAAPSAAAENPREPATPPAFAPSFAGVGAVTSPTGLSPEVTSSLGIAPLPPPPAPAKPMPVGGNIHAPERTSYTVPDYPVVARAAKVEGVVILEATIDETGIVRGVRVLRSLRGKFDVNPTWCNSPSSSNRPKSSEPTIGSSSPGPARTFRSWSPLTVASRFEICPDGTAAARPTGSRAPTSSATASSADQRRRAPTAGPATGGLDWSVCRSLLRAKSCCSVA